MEFCLPECALVNNPHRGLTGGSLSADQPPSCSLTVRNSSSTADSPRRISSINKPNNNTGRCSAQSNSLVPLIAIMRNYDQLLLGPKDSRFLSPYPSVSPASHAPERRTINRAGPGRG
ncbi:hypothetical protein CC79DRAFT_1336594 [Sarocladium strictum]